MPVDTIEIVMPDEYLAITQRAQVARLRPLVRTVLDQYGLESDRVRLLLHDYNTSFRIDTSDGRRFALRINVHSRREPEHLDAEAAWLEALRGSGVIAPVPLRTTDGRAWTTAWSDALRREVPAVLMTWLPGRDLDVLLDGRPDTRNRALDAVRALGRTMAALHDHAAGWTLPPGSCLPHLDRVERERFHLLDPVAASVVVEVAEVVQAAIDRARSDEPGIALHADLHAGNVKWFRRRIAVFDFDDAAHGVPAQDLAIATYYLRDDDGAEAALRTGYAGARDLPRISTADFEALVAGRNLQILHDVLGGIGAADRNIAAAYTRNTVVKLRAFLDSGRYRHDVPGLETISL